MLMKVCSTVGGRHREPRTEVPAGESVERAWPHRNRWPWPCSHWLHALGGIAASDVCAVSNIWHASRFGGRSCRGPQVRTRSESRRPPW